MSYLIRSISVQHLEAPQPHAGLRVHVDAHAVTRPEPQEPLHPAHPAAEAAGFPSIPSSTHRKNGPHLPLCVRHATGPRTPHRVSPTPAASSVRGRRMCRQSETFTVTLRSLQPSKVCFKSYSTLRKKQILQRTGSVVAEHEYKDHDWYVRNWLMSHEEQH